MNIGYVVVTHPCYGYGADAMRVYRGDDPYLCEHPSMYRRVASFDTLAEAEALISGYFAAEEAAEALNRC